MFDSQGDARRSKQYIVNQNNQNNLQHNPQKQHSVQPPRSTTTFTPPTQQHTTVSTTTLRPIFEQSRIIAASTYRPSIAPKKSYAEKTTAAYKVSNNNNNNKDFFKHQKTSDFNGILKKKLINHWYFNSTFLLLLDDEILKESQSAHFYNNRNNGKEDFEEDFARSTKAPALPAKQKLRGRQRGRSKFRGDNVNAVPSAQEKTTVAIASSTTQRSFPTEQQQQRQTFTNSPIVVQQSTTSNSRFNYDTFRTNQNATTTLQASNVYRSTSTPPAPFSSTPAHSTRQATVASTTQDSTFFDVPKINQKSAQNQYKAAPQNIEYNTQSTIGQPQQQNRFNVIPQRVIVPNNLSLQHRLALQASNNNFQSTVASSQSSSTTESSQILPQYSRTNNPINHRQNEQKPQVQVAQQQSKDFSKSTPQKFNFKTQKYESAEPLHPTTQFYNSNYETKGSTVSNFANENLELTRNNNKTFSTRQFTTSSLDDVNRPTTFNPQQFYQNQQYQQPQQSQQQLPRGFSAPQKSTTTPQTQTTQQQLKRKTPQPDSRYQTIARTEARDQHTPSTHKKFSTLVPKENYNPTTFKPNNFSKKPVDHIASQKLEKVQNPNKYYTQFVTSVPPTTVSVATTTTTTTTTQQPQQNFNNYQQNQNQNNNFAAPQQKQSQQNEHQQNRLQNQQQNRHQNQQQIQEQQNRQSNFFSSTTTARPLAENEEDDGQYRPELYEKDFYRNKAKTSKAPAVPRGNNNINNNNNNFNNFFQTTTTTTTTSTLRPFNQNLNQNNNNHNSNHYNSAEDEFLKTAHSQNIAASGNELRAQKERARQQVKFNDYTTTVNEKSSPRPFSKPTTTTTTPTTTTISHRAVTTSRPSKKVEKDVSYDYQYYDTHNENNDYTEYGAAEDFGRLSKKSN